MPRPARHSPSAVTPSRSARVVSAIARIGQVLRQGAWQFGTAQGLNPAQVDVLELLSHREDAVRLSWIASQLSVSNASASDSVAALVAKGLVTKARSAEDARAVALRLSDAGKALASRISASMQFAHDAVDALPAATQDALYGGLLSVIAELQHTERFPQLRSCVSCKHFAMNRHADPAAPHHCKLLDTPLPIHLLRLDCPEHEAASPVRAHRNARALAVPQSPRSTPNLRSRP